MQKTLGAALCFFSMVTVDGCGDSLAALHRLSAPFVRMHPSQRTCNSRSSRQPQGCGLS
jgi:hypothetical protein